MRMRTKITILTAAALLTIALPAAASKYDGTIMFGMITVDETFGDRSSVQETYNIFNGFNVTQLRDKIGPEVESMDMLQLKNKMDALDHDNVLAETARVTADWEYPLGKPADEVIERAIRMYR